MKDMFVSYLVAFFEKFHIWHFSINIIIVPLPNVPIMLQGDFNYPNIIGRMHLLIQVPIIVNVLISCKCQLVLISRKM